jgi:hypothetical protein
VDCKVDPAFYDGLVNFFVEYSSLLEGKQRPSLAHVARGFDDFSIYLQARIFLSNPVDHKIGLNQGQLAVPGSDLEKYSRITMVELSR